MNTLRLLAHAAALVCLAAIPAAGQVGPARAEGLEPLALTVDGVERDALVYAPASAGKEPSPLVFIFHGHGGTSRNAARQIGIHREWPEAICVYPQGLPTPGHITDPQGKKTGWQRDAADQGARDLAFFDALLARLKKDYKVDTRRIYSTGHSNGGAFTYQLWAERGEVFAAMAPSASVDVRSVRKLNPKPAFHLAGEKNPLVKYPWQQRMMQAVRRANACTDAPTTWAPGCLQYPSADSSSKSPTPFVSYIHPGGHEFPAGASKLIVRFFKEHPAAR